MVDNKVIMPGSRQYLAQAKLNLYKNFPKYINSYQYFTSAAFEAQPPNTTNYR
jgi:hypothetical protein